VQSNRPLQQESRRVVLATPAMLPCLCIAQGAEWPMTKTLTCVVPSLAGGVRAGAASSYDHHGQHDQTNPDHDAEREERN